MARSECPCGFPDPIRVPPSDGQKLAVDANGRFDLDTAVAYAKALSQYDLFWYEEPGDPLDFELQAALRNYYKNPMATGRVRSAGKL